MSAAVTTELKTIGHWIGGESIAGESGRKGPVYNPATGEQSGEVRFASVEEIDHAVATADGRVRDVAPVVALEARRALLPHLPARRRAPRGSRAAPHRRARQGPLRRARRGAARHRGDRVRLRDPAAPEGRLLRAGLDRDRRVLDPAAARRRGRHHAVQLPGDGAHVDVGARDRVRQHVHPQAVREGPVRVDPDRRAAQGGRASRTASSTSSRATRSRSTRSSSTPASRRSASSARLRSRATSTRPGRRPGSACRRSAARRTT